jgi:indole-3-glycerol phosphate synthase
MTHVQTGTILDEILARTTADLSERKSTVPVSDLAAAARSRPAPLSLRAALAGPEMSVIAEIKRASPSRGTFPVIVDPANLAREYIAGGAAAISVLTDEPFFQGSLADLDTTAGVARTCGRPVPVLRKDFVVDPYQIVEARAHGADAVLLIVAALDDALLTELLAVAAALGMDALVEVHDEREMERAVVVRARLVGINNRNLQNFSVDLSISERLAPLAPNDTVVVGESGIFGPDEVKRLHDVGTRAVLVGEGLVTAPDRAAAVKALLRWQS